MTSSIQVQLRWLLAILLTAFWVSCCWAVRNQVTNSLRTVANLLEAMREGDYSIRGRVGSATEPMSQVMQQVNAMASTLRDQRLGALEATALLRKVMEEIDVAAFAFDPQRVLRLVNRAGERLLAQPAERLLLQTADSLGLADFLSGGDEQTVQCEFPGGNGRWGIRLRQFREAGVPHQLLDVADLTRPLREEEFRAWQRMVRVLGHELNNSLTPIKSIAQSLEGLLKLQPAPDDLGEDMQRGLHVIATRSEALSRLVNTYARLAKMPPPQFAALDLVALLRRVVALETRVRIAFEADGPLEIQGDGDQLELALINLVKNAVEASEETGGRVYLRHSRAGNAVEITVRDEGRGILNSANLFVPFFTTKRGGSGIGLVLSRQIVEAHNGFLTLQNAADGPGCEAKISLPL
jgi:two-component system, NtrC family, nitrogen regulation sensor histidine kinase NtrY